jgi:hypothetical protein
MGCQRTIAQKIREQGADYVLVDCSISF